MKDWDYAEQSRKAKEYGGPENYADYLIHQNDAKWITAIATLAIPAVIGCYHVGKCAINKIKNIKTKKKNDAIVNEEPVMIDTKK